MTEPLAKMWINASRWREECQRAEAALAKAGAAAHDAAVDIEETSRELIEKLKQLKNRPVSGGEDPCIETPAPFEHSLPVASMLNL